MSGNLGNDMTWGGYFHNDQDLRGDTANDSNVQLANSYISAINSKGPHYGNETNNSIAALALKWAASPDTNLVGGYYHVEPKSTTTNHKYWELGFDTKVRSKRLNNKRSEVPL